MELKIKNIDVAKVTNFLTKTNFKGMQSVNRSKVTRFLSDYWLEVVEGENTIREDYKGNEDKLKKELNQYFSQTVTIEGANYLAGLTAIKNKIKELTDKESEQEFSNEDADALFILYDAFKLGGDE